MTSRNQRRNKRNNKRNSPNQNDQSEGQSPSGARDRVVSHERSSTETKASLKTTELMAYAGVVLAVIMTALAIDEDGQGGTDPFGAELAIRYITFLTIGYMIARGLAKAGSHENYGSRDTAETHVDDNDTNEAPSRETPHADSQNDDNDSENENDVTDIDVPSHEKAQHPGTNTMDGNPQRA